MPVEAVDADVELAAEVPLRVRHVPRVELVPGLDPVEPVPLLRPEGAEALLGGGPLVDPRIGDERVGDELRRRREGALLAQEVLDRLAVVASFGRHAPILARRSTWTCSAEGCSSARLLASVRPMADFLGATAIAFGAIFLAEFGDKSQLLTLAFATRYPWRPVSSRVSSSRPRSSRARASSWARRSARSSRRCSSRSFPGIAFLAVAAWTLLGDDDEEEGHPSLRPLAGTALVLTVAGTFIAARARRQDDARDVRARREPGAAPDLDRLDARRGGGQPGGGGRSGGSWATCFRHGSCASARRSSSLWPASSCWSRPSWVRPRPRSLGAHARRAAAPRPPRRRLPSPRRRLDSRTPR